MSWASGHWPQTQRISYIASPDTTDREPATTIVDWWTEPPMALDPAECDHILEVAHKADPVPSGNGTYFPLGDVMDRGLQADLIARVQSANAQWWRLDVDEFFVAAKRYRPGEQQTAHQDWVPGTACRKLVGGWQLAAPDSYEGGAVVITYGPHRLTVPRDRGACFMMPNWCVHEVQPITAGERWSLLLNGYGPPLR